MKEYATLLWPGGNGAAPEHVEDLELPQMGRLGLPDDGLGGFVGD